VAVVGSGPAGLAAAQQLNRVGHSVTVFERADYIGGLLMLGIPDFKLDKDVVRRRVQLMADEGVAFRTGVNVGVNYSVEELRANFDAVCLTGGSTQARDLPVPGRELRGVHLAMEYLPQQNRLLAGERIDPQEHISAEGKRVVILGGGDTGADCLGTAHRQGAEVVYQFELLPEPPAQRPDNNPWPQWPLILRSSPAHEEGGIRDYNILTKAFSGSEGKLEKLHAVRVEWIPGDNGRPTMKEVPGTEFEVETELVLLAMGFLHPEHEGLLTQLGVELDPRGNVKTNADKMTSVPGIFAGGDMARGQSLVVWAIAEGREVARGVDAYLVGQTSLPKTMPVA
jgi:glutamate synthase (NADPH/NADH) small chain